MTRRGRLTLALGAATYLAAWAFGAQALYAPAVGLVLLVGAANLWTNVLARPLRLQRTLDREHPTEGDDVVLRLELEGDGGLLPPSAVVHAPAGPLGPREVTLLRDGPRLRGVHRARNVRRGRYRLTGTRIVVEDPFGLAHREQQLEGGGALLVYPRLAAVDVLFSERGLRAHGAGRMLLRRSAGFELHSVREYQSGESLRRVHWPTTARRQQLMVKELEDAPRDEAAVVLDAQAGLGAGEPPDSSFDAQVRAAGSVLWAHARRGRHARLIVTSGRDPETLVVRSYERDWPDALELLAAAEQTGIRPVEAIVGDPAGAATHSRDLVVVTAMLRPALVDALVARAAARQQVSVVYVEAPSFAPRARRRNGAEPALLRLQAAGITAAVVRRGADLASVLSLPEARTAHA